MTTLKNGMTATVVALLTMLLVGFILLGDQRPAHAAPGDTIVNGVFCFLNGLPITNVFSISGCSNGAPEPSAELTLVKDVVNTGGGTAAATDWTLSATGSTTTNPTTISGVTGSGTVTDANVQADTYTLSESGGPSGYTPSAWVCTAGTLSGSSVTLAGGDDATCTITNTFNAPSQYTVTIDKFIDGVAASTTAATSSFPMVSSWNATNLGGAGSGSYSLGPTGFNSPNAYEAVTSAMDSGSSYTTNEDTTGAVVGADCTTGDPYALVGYSSGSSLAAAETATVSGTAPDFSNLTQNENVIVWNESCPAAGTTGVLAVKKVISGGSATPDQFSFGINGAATTTFNVSGENDITEPVGTYTVAETASSTYTPSYANSANANTDCSDLAVTANATTTCTITNTYNSSGGGGGTGGSTVNQTIVVTPSDMQGWAFVNDETNGAGTGMMVVGPATPPLGVGSAELTATSTSDGEILATLADQGVKLSDLTQLSYATYQNPSNPSDATAIALQFNVAQDVTNLASGWQGRIVFEPYYNNGGTVPFGTWTTWDALDSGNAMWWFSDPADFGGNCPQSSPCSLSSIIALYPNIGINPNPSLGGIVLKAGSGWTSFDGNVDDLVIGTTDGTNATTTTYDFEPDVSHITVTKSADNTTPNIGDTVTYTITASDTGVDATNVVVSDVLPSGLTFVSTTTPDVVGTYASSTGEWDIGDLSSTTPATLHIEATVNSGQSSGTVIDNTATVTSGDNSGNTSGNSASAPVTVTIPSSSPTPSATTGGGGGGGNGPIFGSFGGGSGPISSAPTGQVLGASTSTVPLGSCTQYLTSFIKLGGNNDPAQVTRLQEFLDQFEGDDLPITGVYDQATYNAVKAFQQKYAGDILTPWGENAPTGYVYLTTRREINIIYCDYTEQFPLTAQEQAQIQAYKDESVGGVTHQSSAQTQNSGLSTPANTGNGAGATTPANTQTNLDMNEVGAAGVTQSGGGFWGAIGSFFANLFHH